MFFNEAKIAAKKNQRLVATSLFCVLDAESAFEFYYFSDEFILSLS